jgi:hypothetical protein
MTTRYRSAPARDCADGSAVVAALVIGLVVSTVLATLSYRSIGDSLASRSRIDRSQAAALSEYGVAAAMAELASGLAVELRRAGPSMEVLAPAVLPVAPPEQLDVGPEVELEVTISLEEQSEDLVIVSRAVVRQQTDERVARVRPRTTSDYLRLTAFEVVDPVLFQRPRSSCAAPRGDVLRAQDCVEVVLTDGVLDGPVHSNDVLEVGDGVVVTSMLTTSTLARDGEGVVAPSLSPSSSANVLTAAPFGLHHEPSIELPLSTSTISMGTTITCRFRGPTLIRLDGPVVRVTSPRSVERPGDDASGPGAIGCMGVDRQLLAHPTPILLPGRAVIEVVRDRQSDCVHHPLGIASGEDDVREWWCTGGDAFVWGAYEGRRTVLAEDNIQVVWDLRPRGGADEAHRSSDALGLVAGDSIVLRRPVGPTIRRVAPYGLNLLFAGPHIPPFGAYPADAPTSEATSWDAPTIVASLVALRGSVGVQNPLRGEQHPGPVRIEGSLATRFHGIFGWEDRTATGALRGAMGYSLELRYDRNLLDVTPPGMPLTAGGEVRVLDLAGVPGSE